MRVDFLMNHQQHNGVSRRGGELLSALLLEPTEKNNHQVLWVIFRASVNSTQITRVLTIEANLGKSRQVFSSQ